MTRTVTKKSLIDHFSALDDPRQAWKVEYRLPEIMLLVLCATPAGAETIDAGHGRIETRRHFVSHDVDWLVSNRRFPGAPRFPGLKAIAMVEAVIETKATGALANARRYFISSMALDAPLFAKAARAHWGIENRLHWVLDVVCHDDLMRPRTQNGPKNMAAIKHMALNMVKSAPGKDSLRAKRKAAR